MSANDINAISGVWSFKSAAGGGPQTAAAGNIGSGGGKSLPAEVRAELAPHAEELAGLGRSIGRALRFEVDLDRGRTVIHVLDRDTGEVIRRIPLEKTTGPTSRYVTVNGAFPLRLHDEKV